MINLKASLLVTILSTIASCSNAEDIIPDQIMLFKVVNGDSLYLHVFRPMASKVPTAAIIFFFGGGWQSGSPRQFYQQGEYLASRGMMAISAEYRTGKKYGTSPFDCVEDGKSAIRWVRQHAAALNIDPDKIVASGGSAGGHVAICTTLTNQEFENPAEDLSISSIPNAVIGYNPVFDTTEKGYGHEKVKGRETEISPCHQVKKGMPPMLHFHGKSDVTVPFENAERFTTLMKEAGNECELIAFEGANHGFFNGDFFRKGADNRYFNQCMYETDVFLARLGFLEGKPTIEKNPKKALR